MTLQLYFVPHLFPRTIGRKEWRDIFRWKRTTEKKLEAELDKQLDDFAVYGSTWLPQMRQDFMDRVVNPPLLIHDKMAHTQEQIDALPSQSSE